MVMIAHVSRYGVPIAEVTYRAGMHVEVRVAIEFQDEKIDISLSRSDNPPLKGSWEEALDNYFNVGQFDSREYLFPGEMARFGSAKDHKSLFRKAIQALRKDLEPLGFTVEVEFL